MMHHVKVWKEGTCSDAPFFEELNVSNTCINLRDGHSVYYDCSTAHLPSELSAGVRSETSIAVTAFLLMITHAGFVYGRQ